VKIQSRSSKAAAISAVLRERALPGDERCDARVKARILRRQNLKAWNILKCADPRLTQGFEPRRLARRTDLLA
jgi:hypothetical protein